jgi:hypothetical protein
MDHQWVGQVALVGQVGQVARLGDGARVAVGEAAPLAIRQGEALLWRICRRDSDH